MHNMNFFIKKIVVTALVFFTLHSSDLFAQQNGTFKGTHKQKHRGRRERKNSKAYNPYIDGDTNKSKGLASKAMAKDEKRAARQQKRAIRKEKRRLRRQGKGYK